MPKSKKAAAAAAVAASPTPELQKPFDPGAGVVVNTGDLTKQADIEERLLPPPSLGEGIGAALRLETIMDSAAKSYVDSTFDADPEFTWTPERWKQATDGLPPEFHKHIVGARSLTHALWKAGNIRQELDDAATLSRMGAAGVGLRVGAAVLDPAQAVLALATGPLGASAKATRLQNVFRSGLAAGGSNALIEGYLARHQATRDATEVFEAGLLGFVVGAPLGALSKAENATMRALASRGHEQSLLGRVEDAASDGLTITDAGRKALAGSRATPQQQADYWRSQIDANQADAARRSARAVQSTSDSLLPQNARRTHADTLRSELTSAAAREDFLKRIQSAPVEGAERGVLDEHAEFLFNSAFSRAGGKPNAMQLAFARAAVRQAARSAKDANLKAAGADRAAKQAAFDAADARQESVLREQVEAAYRQRDLQDAGLEVAAARVERPEPPRAEDAGRDFQPGDTVWFERGDQLISGKVDAISGNGKVMVKDDATGKVLGFHPDRDDPLGEFSGIVAKASRDADESEAAVFRRGSIGSGQTADVEVPETALSTIKIGKFEIPIRWDYFAIFMRSPLGALKKLAVDVVADPVGFADKRLARGATASELAEMTRLRYEKRFLASFEDHFADYYRRTNTSWLQAEKARARFAEDITLITRGDAARAAEVPEAAKVVAEVRAVHGELLEMAQRHGVDGAEVIDPDPFYIMRKFNHDRIRMIAGKYDEKGVVQLIAGAIRSARAVDEAMAEKIATGYWKTVTGLPYDRDLSDVIQGPKMFGRLRGEMQRLGVDDDVIDDVIEAVSGRAKKVEGDSPRLKHRTVMDELYSADVLTRDGQLERLSIGDLFINDSRLLMRQYTRQMSGLVGFARMGIKSDADWQLRLDEVRAEAQAKGVDPAKLQKHVGYMEDIRAYVLGRPMAGQEYGTFDRVARVLRDINFIRNMGQAGFAQVPEIGNLMGLAGMRAFRLHIPAFNEVLRHAGGRTLDDELARDLINMGLGAEHLSIKPNLREMDEWAFDRNLSALERLTEKGKYITANVSGLAAMNDALHTLASKAFVQKFSDYAQGYSKLGTTDLARLNWAGIGEDNIDGIFKRLREFTQVGDNGRVEGIRWEEWQRADPESFDAFNLAVFRESRKAIQQPTIGETAPWMHTQIGKILTQFRSFTLVAWAKQGMHNLHYADASTAVAWSLSMVFAGAAYAAQNAINFAHDDAQRRKRLEIDEIAKAAFQRAGFASLTPGAIDTVMQFTRGEPMFAYGRTTGLGTGFIVGNPTMDLVSSKILGTLQNASRSVFDDEHLWTRKDVKNGLGLFLPNYIGVRNFVDAASSEFPSRNFLEQRDDR
jgi:hypothetical protein